LCHYSFIQKEGVFAAGAVVNKLIPVYEIWGGVTAKKMEKK